MEPQIVLKIDNNHTLKASNFKIFLGACPQTSLASASLHVHTYFDHGYKSFKLLVLDQLKIAFLWA